MSWLIDPTTGDYVLLDGHFVRDDGLQGVAYLALVTERGSHPDDPEFGSRLHTLRRRKSASRAALEVPDMVHEALEHLVDDGRIARVDVVVEARATGGLPGVAAQITLVDGNNRSYGFEVFQEVG